MGKHVAPASAFVVRTFVFVSVGRICEEITESRKRAEFALVTPAFLDQLAAFHRDHSRRPRTRPWSTAALGATSLTAVMPRTTVSSRAPGPSTAGASPAIRSSRRSGLRLDFFAPAPPSFARQALTDRWLATIDEMAWLVHGEADALGLWIDIDKEDRDNFPDAQWLVAVVHAARRDL